MYLYISLSLYIYIYIHIHTYVYINKYIIYIYIYIYILLLTNNILFRPDGPDEDGKRSVELTDNNYVYTDKYIYIYL